MKRTTRTSNLVGLLDTWHNQLQSGHSLGSSECRFFSTTLLNIRGSLLQIEKEAPWVDQVVGQLQLLKMDLRFLHAFSKCLETLVDASDEESREIMRMITPLQEIWPEEDMYLYSTKEAWTIKRFHSVNFVLQGKIQQSKQQVVDVVWCGNLMRCSDESSLLGNNRRSYYVNHLYWELADHLEDLLMNLKDFSSYRGDKIVPLKKQTDILKDNILFLKKSVMVLDRSLHGEGNRPFRDFVADYTDNATCVACFYWAKEDEEDVTTQTSTLLFDMSRKFMLLAYDITPLYFRIQKSRILQYSGPSLLGDVVESWVDFLFGHLDYVLKDDFLLLRDGLIFLFTFLMDPPPCENVEDEDLIRGQIYALFHDDNAYLRLPFNEMKEDFSHKQRILLSDFMILVDTAVAKVGQVYRGNISDSWIILEVDKMINIYFSSIQRELTWIEKHARWADLVPGGQLQLYILEIRFLKMFLLCFVTCDDVNDEEIRVSLGSIITCLQGIWRNGEDEKGFLAHRLHAIRRRTGDIVIDWHPLSSELQEKIQLSKLEIEARSVNLFSVSSFQCTTPLTSRKISKFMDFILDNLDDLVGYKAGEIVLFREQIDTMEERIVFLRRFLKLPVDFIDSKELEEFKMLVQLFANDAALLMFLYWAKGADQFSSERNSIFSHMLHKITPCAARLYFGALKAMYLQRPSDSLMVEKMVFSFVYHFLEDPVTRLNDDFRILQDDILFLLSFLLDPPDGGGSAKELICSQIDLLFREDVYSLLPYDQDGVGDFSTRKLLLSDLVKRIQALKSNIRQNYCEFLDLSLYNSPKVVSPHFLEFLLQNLRNIKIGMISDRENAPLAKYMPVKIEEELTTLCPLFNHIFDLRDEQTDTWSEVVDLLHLTELVTSSWFCSWSVFDHPIWNHMANLWDVFDKIKVVKTKLEKIKESTMYHTGHSRSTHTEQAIPPSQISEIFVGFEDEAKKITDKLIWGHTSLDIVSVVGMGGLGKTTLAKKVYDSLSKKRDFLVFAFGYVSQDHNTRRLLHGILSDIEKGDEKIRDMTEDDLAQKLWQSLSCRKYLIVLDDIWDASVWNKIKRSFPDDKNGSRVMITTRSHDVAPNPYRLRFMSKVESWELLQKKVFSDGISPPYLNEIGKLIAKNCNGLPLAVTLIAGLLSRTKISLSWWTEVSERVVSYLSDEGCMKFLELSYKHLPDNLKPCLLYLGAFPKDTLIRVKRVMLLWIAEGFIQASNTKSLEDVAREYLADLVDRSLIIVGTRSSNGEIKMFCVHDLIHHFCQTKCRDRDFLKLNHGIVSSSSLDSLVNNYRVSMQNQVDVNILVARSSVSNARSLLYTPRAQWNYAVSGFPLSKVRLAQVLDLDITLKDYGNEQLSSMPLLRHVDVVMEKKWFVVPSLGINLWNIGSLMFVQGQDIHLPKTFWRMKSLRHVKIEGCMLNLSDGHESEVYPKLDNVVSFSTPVLYTGKDVQWLLQRLPLVQRLSCRMDDYDYGGEEPIETLDFHRKLESLTLCRKMEIEYTLDSHDLPLWLCRRAGKIRYLINFPSTLKKLTLMGLDLPSTVISSIAELHCLEVLKLRYIHFPEPRLEMEDLAFQKLKFFELVYKDLEEWKATTESLPCLEHLVIFSPKLQELPICLQEISTLKSISVRYSPNLASSALRIQEEQKELGIQVSVSIKGIGIL